MATASSAWADAHQDILGHVFSLLPSITDRARSSAVCRHWRFVAVQSPPPPLPCLLMPSTAGTSYFCVFGGTTTDHPAVPDYALSARFCGSYPGGWFAVALHQSHGHELLNLHCGERIPLPDHLRVLVRAQVYSESTMVIHAATLSAAPTPGDPYIVAAITSGNTNIAFWRPGMDGWSPPLPTPAQVHVRLGWPRMIPEDTIEDVIYYRCAQHEGFFVLTAEERLLVYVPENGADGALTMRLHVYRFQDHRLTLPGRGQVVSRYLVESSGGRLLMVKRFRARHGTVSFQVFRLQWAYGPRWHRSTVLTGQVLFVGRGCSRAMATGSFYPGYIYFLDDAEGFPGARQQYRCSDTGRCCYFTQNVQWRLPRGPPSDCSPWIWFFH